MDEKDWITLEEFHLVRIDQKIADKIKALLLFSPEFTYGEIEKIGLVDERTLNRCIRGCTRTRE